MRVVLHLGAHKTGSTLIQHYFRDRPLRRRPHDVRAIPRHETADLIGWGDTVVRHPNRLRYRLEAESLTGVNHLVVSEERALGRPFVVGRPGLYPDARHHAAALAEICQPFETSVIFYVRPLCDFIESYYLQLVKQGSENSSFEAWFPTIGPHELTWSDPIDAITDVFGAAARFGDFREIDDGTRSFIRRFLDRGGLPQPFGVGLSGRPNSGLTDEGLRHALATYPTITDPQQRQAFRASMQLYQAHGDASRARPMTVELRHAHEARYTADYERLVASFPSP